MTDPMTGPDAATGQMAEMWIEFEVVSVVSASDGRAVVWLRSLIPEPGTAHVPLFPAICSHQNVERGSWWRMSMSPSERALSAGESEVGR